MIGDDDDPVGGTGAAGQGGSLPHLRRVAGPLGPAEPPPAVRLCREWKGLTVADLLRDEIVERLPGHVRSAARHIERGDLAAADRMLDQVAPVLQGPGHRRRERRGLVALVVLAAVFVGVMVAALFQ